MKGSGRYSLYVEHLSYIRISFFSATKEIENIKKSISSVENGILRVEVYQMTDGYGWCVLPSVKEFRGIQQIRKRVK